MKSVKRHDYQNTHGWYVRVHFKGKTHGKLFSDGVYGGRGIALAAAIGWRNGKEIELGKNRTDRTIHYGSGVTYRPGRWARWEVSWSHLPNDFRRKVFPIKLFGGKKKAKLVAEQFRADRIAEIEEVV